MMLSTSFHIRRTLPLLATAGGLALAAVAHGAEGAQFQQRATGVVPELLGCPMTDPTSMPEDSPTFQVNLLFLGFNPISGEEYPFEGVFRVQTFDREGLPVPEVCVKLEAHKADGAVTRLTTTTTQQGERGVRVRSPEGNNQLFVLDAGKEGFVWGQFDAPPSFAWSNVLTVTAPLEPPSAPATPTLGQFVVSVRLGCEHTQPGVQSQFQTLWGLSTSAGEPVAGAFFTMTTSGPGVLNPFAVGTADPSGQARLISPINRLGHYDGTLTGLTGPDGTNFLPLISFDGPDITLSEDGWPGIGFDVGAQCTSPWSRIAP